MNFYKSFINAFEYTETKDQSKSWHNIMQDLKDAMLIKNSLKIEVCRSIKSAILLSKTENISEFNSSLENIESIDKIK